MSCILTGKQLRKIVGGMDIPINSITLREDAKELHVTLTGQRIECRVYGATVEVGGNFSCSL
jgi:hypothetical protein